MTMLEKNIIEYLVRKKEILLFLLISLGGIATRYLFRNAELVLPETGKHLWLTQILLPGHRLIAGVGDYVLAFFAAYTIWKDVDRSTRMEKAITVYGLIVFSLPVLCASSILGRIDVLYVVLSLVALRALLHEQWWQASVCLGAAAALDLRALYLFPVIVMICLKKGTIPYLPTALAVLVWLAIRVPELLTGYGIIEGYAIPASTEVGIYTGYPSFWGFLQGEAGTETKYFVMIWVISIMAICGLARYIYEKRELRTEREWWLCGFLLLQAENLLLPMAKPGNGYLLEVVALIAMFYSKELLFPSLLLQLAAVYTYMAEIYGAEVLPMSVQGMSWVLLLLLGWSLWGWDIANKKIAGKRGDK